MRSIISEVVIFIPKWIFHKIRRIFVLFCKRLPLRDDILVFRSEGDFSDNSRALYEYLMSQDDKKRIFIWLVENPHKYPKRNNTIFLSPSRGLRFRYFYYINVAKNIIETHNLTQISVRLGQNYICLWHGIPMKKNKDEGKVVLPPMFTHLLCSSVHMIPHMAGILHCDEKNVIPLGFPRNDVLLNNKSKGLYNPLAIKGSYEKVIIWMPTFRASINPVLSETLVDTNTGLPLLTNFESIKLLSNYCKSKKLLIIIKIHHLQADKDIFNMQFDNLLFIQDEQLQEKRIQLYEMIGKTDALITDYSSVFIDYLLLNKPMGFIATDFDDYEKTRGVPFADFLEKVPGQLIYSIDDLKLFLNNVLEDTDLYEEKRMKLLPIFHDYTDAHSCRRIQNYFNL